MQLWLRLRVWLQWRMERLFDLRQLLHGWNDGACEPCARGSAHTGQETGRTDDARGARCSCGARALGDTAGPCGPGAPGSASAGRAKCTASAQDERHHG
jgi:hypothetical protein